MGIECDVCMDDISLWEAEEEADGTITCNSCRKKAKANNEALQPFVCAECYEKAKFGLPSQPTEGFAHSLVRCGRCHKYVPTCGVIDKIECRQVCPICSHAIEREQLNQKQCCEEGCALCKLAKVS